MANPFFPAAWLSAACLLISACGDTPGLELEAGPIAELVASEPAPAPSPTPQTFQRGNGEAYELLGSQVWDVPDPVSGRNYQVFVFLPASYAEAPGRTYPVLYVTDADYAFPIIRQISRRMNLEKTRIADFILVGLSYAEGDTGGTSRQRDYTPTPNGPSGAAPGSMHGQAAAYQTYLRDQVKPFIASRFRAAPGEDVLLGHSYGGLLGAQILLTEPEMFRGYVLGSPSFWFDNRHILTLEADYAKAHDDLKADVYMYVGEYEARKPGDPRYMTSVDMVADMQTFQRRMEGRGYPGLHISAEVLNDENHMSVAPRGFTHGLLELLPAD